MPRNESTNWSVWDQMTATRLQEFNDEIDQILTHWSDKWRVVNSAAQTSVLDVDIAAFSWIVWTTKWMFVWIVDLTMTDDAINYIEINASWTLSVNTTAFDPAKSRVWKVTTVGWIITEIEDWRPDVIWWESWWWVSFSTLFLHT